MIREPDADPCSDPESAKWHDGDPDHRHWRQCPASGSSSSESGRDEAGRRDEEPQHGILGRKPSWRAWPGPAPPGRARSWPVPAASPRWPLAAIAGLDTIAGRTGQIAARTRARLSGEPADPAARLVSLHDPDARPARKGRPGKPAGPGCRARVTGNADGIVADCPVHDGSPAGAPLPAPAIGRIKTLPRRAPGAATAGRGYGEAAADAGPAGPGVKKAAIPRKGKPRAASTPAASASWPGGAPAPRPGSPASGTAAAGTAACPAGCPAPLPGAGPGCPPAAPSRSRRSPGPAPRLPPRLPGPPHRRLPRPPARPRRPGPPGTRNQAA
jgi:hypothetical protein